MADAARNLDRHFTYGNYRSWDDGERWELIEGQAWSMSAAPMTRHQDIQAELITALRNFLRGKPCKAFAAPFDVLLPAADEADDEVDTVVQPDIAVFCDRSKLTEAGARGVREYWVVEPGNSSVLAFRLKAPRAFDEGELRDLIRDTSPIASEALEGFIVDPRMLFAELD